MIPVKIISLTEQKQPAKILNDYLPWITSLTLLRFSGVFSYPGGCKSFLILLSVGYFCYWYVKGGRSDFSSHLESLTPTLHPSDFSLTLMGFWWPRCCKNGIFMMFWICKEKVGSLFLFRNYIMKLHSNFNWKWNSNAHSQ